MPSRDEATSPTVLRRQLSRRLRALRLAAGLTQRDVASRLGWSHGKIGHLESQHVRMRPEDLRVLLPLYGLTRSAIQPWLRDARRSRHTGWWDHPQLPDWWRRYLGLESGAAELHSYHWAGLPPLLQTRDYAHAALTATTPSPSDVTRLVEQRMRRQHALTRQHRPLQLHTLLDEAALARTVGTERLMHDQLTQLDALAVGSRNTITVRIVPFDAGPHRATGAFSWLTFPGADTSDNTALPDDPGILYIEHSFDTPLVEHPDQIQHARELLAELQQNCLDSHASAQLIAHYRHRYEQTDDQLRTHEDGGDQL